MMKLDIPQQPNVITHIALIFNTFTHYEELISALFDWDGNAGCYLAYLPGERPMLGRENYTMTRTL